MFVSEQANSCLVLIIVVLNAKDNWGVIEGSKTKFDVVDVGQGIPLISLVEVYLSGFYSDIRAYEVSLDEKWLIISTLYLSLIIISVFDSNCMRVFLVLTSECLLIDPLAVILAHSIKVHPNCPLTITGYSLRSFHINWDLVLPILNVNKRSAWIAISVDIIKLICGEECLVILVLEHFSLDCQPTIGVSHKTVVIIYWCGHLEVQIRKIICLCCCYCFNFPFIRPGNWNTNQSLHLMSFPMYQEECVAFAL